MISRKNVLPEKISAERPRVCSATRLDGEKFSDLVNERIYLGHNSSRKKMMPIAKLSSIRMRVPKIIIPIIETDTFKGFRLLGILFSLGSIGGMSED
jgi:hypothetical protein